MYDHDVYGFLWWMLIGSVSFMLVALYATYRFYKGKSDNLLVASSMLVVCMLGWLTHYVYTEMEDVTTAATEVQFEEVYGWYKSLPYDDKRDYIGRYFELKDDGMFSRLDARILMREASRRASEVRMAEAAKVEDPKSALELAK